MGRRRVGLVFGTLVFILPVGMFGVENYLHIWRNDVVSLAETNRNQCNSVLGWAFCCIVKY
jgi:hypothetical protein